MRHKDLKTTDRYYIHNELNDLKDKMDGLILGKSGFLQCWNKSVTKSVTK
ncbi:MAG: hypothetical protein H6611_04215 [Ignavibacteriales bacterium]|nr:hypothetical protein [Ignavibacteriales bacterium]